MNNKYEIDLEDEPYEIGKDKVEEAKRLEDEKKNAQIEIKKKKAQETKKIKDRLAYDVADAVLDVSEIRENLRSSKAYMTAFVTIIIAFLGCFMNFWSISIKDVTGVLGMGSLFGGFKFFGIFGKLCTIAIFVAFVLLCINLKRYALHFEILSVIALLIQIALLLIFGWNEMDGQTGILPGIGFFLVIIEMIITIVCTLKIQKKEK